MNIALAFQSLIIVIKWQNFFLMDDINDFSHIHNIFPLTKCICIICCHEGNSSSVQMEQVKLIPNYITTYKIALFPACFCCHFDLNQVISPAFTRETFHDHRCSPFWVVWYVWINHWGQKTENVLDRWELQRIVQLDFHNSCKKKAILLHIQSSSYLVFLWVPLIMKLLSLIVSVCMPRLEMGFSFADI